MNFTVTKRKIREKKEDIEKAEQKLTDLRGQLITLEKNSFFKCSNCGKRKKVKNMILFRLEWYKSGYGCTEGAEWVLSPECDFLCENCDKIHTFKYGKEDDETIIWRCKKVVIYRDDGRGGEVLRRKHFKEMLNGAFA